MKKKKFIFLIILAPIFLVGIATYQYIKNDTSFDEFNPPEINKSLSPSRDKIRLGIIGDSWVADNNLKNAIKVNLIESGVTPQISNYGHPGAKSRQILRNLFLSENKKYSSKSILTGNNIDYLVIVAGVNDTAGHIGKEFYAHHISLLIKYSLANGIKPLVLEIPEYGIEEEQPNNLLSFVKKVVYIWLFDDGEVDIINQYRNHLKDNLAQSELLNSTIIIPFSSITNDYKSNLSLYKNPSHLNSKGYSKLGNMISHVVLDTWKNDTSK